GNARAGMRFHRAGRSENLRGLAGLFQAPSPREPPPPPGRDTPLQPAPPAEGRGAGFPGALEPDLPIRPPPGDPRPRPPTTTPGARSADRERGPHALIAHNVDGAAMIRNDAVGERQPKAGPFAGLLGGEEEVERALHLLRRHPPAVVLDIDAYAVADARQARL